MNIQINTDHNIENREAQVVHFTSVVENALSRISEHITRVEVHLNNEVSHKGGKSNKYCMIEARLEGRQPIAVNHQAVTMHQAVDGTTDKLIRLIDGIRRRPYKQKNRGINSILTGPECTNL